MATTTVIDDLAQDMFARYDDDMFLGSLCWYYVPGDFKITISEWVAAIFETEVSNLVPKPSRAVDAFKRAVANTKETKKVRAGIVGQGNFTYKFLPRDAGHDPDHVFRTITVEQLDEAAHKLTYDECVKFAFNRREERIVRAEVMPQVFSDFPEEVAAILTEKVKTVQQVYSDERQCLGPIKIRELLRADIEGRMQGTLARPSGGVYFVFSRHNKRLMAMDELVNGFKPCSFHILPVIDDSKQRQMLKSAFEEESIGEVNILMNQMKELLEGKSGAITMLKAKGFHTRYMDLTKRLALYSDLLEESMEKTGASLKILQTQCMEVFKKSK